MSVSRQAVGSNARTAVPITGTRTYEHDYESDYEHEHDIIDTAVASGQMGLN
jgi:hypothetical protein